MRRNGLQALLLILPSGLILIVALAYPLAYSWLNSLHYYQIFRPQDRQFIGVANFLYLLTQDTQFWESLILTVVYSVGGVSIQMLLGLTLAIWAYPLFPRLRMVRFLLALPMLVAPIATALTWRLILSPEDGPLDRALAYLGLPSLGWLTRPSTALLALVLTEVWQWTPFVFLTLLAGFAAIPRSLRDAASTDGAGYSQYFLQVMLPIVRPILVFVWLVRTIDSFRAFDQIYILTNGGPGTSTYLLPFYVSVIGFSNYNVGLASALGLIILVVIIVLTLTLIATVLMKTNVASEM